MKVVRLRAIHVAIAFAFCAGTAGACVGEGTVSFVGVGGSASFGGGLAGTPAPAGGAAGGTADSAVSGTGGAGGAGASDGDGSVESLDQEGGGNQPEGNLADARDVNADSPVPGDSPADQSIRDGGNDARDGLADGGQPTIVFSFDSAAEVALWDTLNDVNGNSSGGPLSWVADEAVPGHVPAGALQWTATFTSAAAVRTFVDLTQVQNWGNRTRLHLTVKVISGGASLQFYQIFVQTGAPGFASQYLLDEPTGPITDSGPVFYDLSLTFMNLAVARAVNSLGLVLHPIAPADGSVPPPAVVEIDNIWVE